MRDRLALGVLSVPRIVVAYSSDRNLTRLRPADRSLSPVSRYRMPILVLFYVGLTAVLALILQRAAGERGA
ncbi:MAG: hypothetical protein WKF73_05770 [Nocardioidaceae bacterium]